MLKYTTRIIPCSGFAAKQLSHVRSRSVEDEANANEQKLIDTMDKLLIQKQQAPVEQFKRLTKSFNEYKSRKPKTFKI